MSNVESRTCDTAQLKSRATTTRRGVPRRSGEAAEAGFTLIELLVVISLITILATMGLVQYKNSIVRTQEAVLRTDLFRMRDAIDQYYADKGKYPSGLEDLVTAGYIRKVPVDPITGSDSTWQTVPTEPDPANPTVEPGVYDVKSGSEAVATDGSKYADW